MNQVAAANQIAGTLRGRESRRDHSSTAHAKADRAMEGSSQFPLNIGLLVGAVELGQTGYRLAPPKTNPTRRNFLAGPPSPSVNRAFDAFAAPPGIVEVERMVTFGVEENGVSAAPLLTAVETCHRWATNCFLPLA